jgi:N-sulfoglucosamine sulfohydrolase
MPTILDAVGLPLTAGMDGTSFLPVLTGGKLPDRDRVFTCYNETSGRRAYPMRCLQTARFGYIFNGWADGTNIYRAEPMNGLTFPAMEAAAKTQPAVAERVDTLLRRAPEELYDFAADPNGLTNLAADPKHLQQLQQMRKTMLAWMEQTQDPLAGAFRAKVR